MIKTNWTFVEESTPFAKLPAGGYVIRIIDAQDVPTREYVEVYYDIAEGEHKGFFDDDFNKANPWKHKFVRSYKDTAKGMFKAFLSRLQESNPNFTIEEWQKQSKVQDFVGLVVGVVLQYEDYTNESGDDKERMNVVGVYNVTDIRQGAYKVPERQDKRIAHSNTSATQSDTFDDVPF